MYLSPTGVLRAKTTARTVHTPTPAPLKRALFQIRFVVAFPAPASRLPCHFYLFGLFVPHYFDFHV